MASRKRDFREEEAELRAKLDDPEAWWDATCASSSNVIRKTYFPSGAEIWKRLRRV
jgi:hypothetical protein